MEAALNYNEQKVQKGIAVCLGASGYLREGSEMNFYQKLQGITRNHELNQKATTKTLHVSLNFDPSEKLSDDRLKAIADQYMEKLGFGEQPYLVYRHQDAGHPHIHIVSTTIKDDGSRINTHNIGKNVSEKVRKELELQFGLIRAEKGSKKALYQPGPIRVEKAVYGRVETKSAIVSIVTHVFQHYRFSSLPEYNAALRQFGVVADRGKEEGRIYRNGGLVYRLLDEGGNKAGVPIKASSLPCRPTLSALEQKFTEAGPLKKEAKISLKNVLDRVLPMVSNLKDFREQLSKQNIFLLPRQNSEGRIYGITYVDNRTKSVFNGSDLGKDFSAAAILGRMSAGEAKNVQKTEVAKNATTPFSGAATKELSTPGKKEGLQKDGESLADVLLTAKEQFDSMPQGLLQKKRKKKKQRNPNSSL